MLRLSTHSTVGLGLSRRERARGVALVIVLAFVVLLTGVVIAYFSRVTWERQSSNSSFNQAKADELARSATATIVEDLKQEIVVGSTATTTSVGLRTITTYVPNSTANILPMRSGNPALVSGTDPIPNLVRRSVRADAIVTPGVGSRASAASGTSVSRNGRSISTARWNAHYLLPRPTGNPDTDSTPVSAFVPPDWVYMTTQGPQALNSPTNSVIGRYAYAIYDEGGLLDVNVAGCPSPTVIGTANTGRKGALAFADLTAVGLTQPQIDSLVGWRNYASAQPGGNLLQGFTFSPTAAINYLNGMLSNTTGFLRTSGTTFNGFSDQMFLSRHQLLAFRQSTGFPATALQYLGTFSREVNQPSWAPPPLGSASRPPTLGTGSNPRNDVLNSGGNLSAGMDDTLNPAFLSIRVQNPFNRYDGTVAYPGDPLVKTRFPLSRLAWITYQGPSANLTPSDPQYNAAGTDANILLCFGLIWNSGTKAWTYTHGDSSRGGIHSLAEVAALSPAREPDFFELLQAGIYVGSLGRTYTIPLSAPWNGPWRYDELAFGSPLATDLFWAHPDAQVIQIGANMIDQADSDSYPTEIRFKPRLSTATTSVFGVENLPYLHRIYVLLYRRALPDSVTSPYPGNSKYPPTDTNANVGSYGLYILPEVWNPHDSGYTMPASALSAPTNFQFVADDCRPDISYNLRTAASNTPSFAPLAPSSVPFSTAGTSAFETREPVIVYSKPTFITTGPDGKNDIAGIPMVRVNCTLDTSGTNLIIQNVDKPADTHTVPALYIASGTTYRNTIVGMQTNSGQIGFGGVLQYQDESGTFRTYSRFEHIAVANFSARIYPNATTTSATNVIVLGWGDASIMFSRPDPRSENFPNSMAEMISGVSGLSQYPNASFQTDTTRPTASSGRYSFMLKNSAPDPVGWHEYRGGLYGSSDMGLLDKNNESTVYVGTGVNTYTYYADPDGVVRGGDGYYQIQTSGTAGDGFPIALNRNVSGSRNYNRPIVLNRPFRSVGELGYAFRGTPCKSIDFFTDQSADSALLDVFCINEPAPSGLSAGVVNLNTRNAPVLQAVISGALKDETPLSGTTGPVPVALSPTQVTAVANALTVLTGTAPLQNRAELVTKFIGSSTAFPLVPGTDDAAVVKRRREAPARALADVSTTRVWNLMIDVVAQSGRFSIGTTKLEDFLVEGEKRYWVHIAIDRATGETIDQNIEPVIE